MGRHDSAEYLHSHNITDYQMIYEIPLSDRIVIKFSHFLNGKKQYYA